MKKIFNIIMERPLVMVGHGFLIGALIYLFMRYIAVEKQQISEKNAVLIGSLSIAYMVQFGHKFPDFLTKR